MELKSLQEYIDNNQITATGRIKKLLFKFEIKERKCECCCIAEIYNNKPLTLQLHHIDGNSMNNNISNLQILCPNCHSQTDNFRKCKKISDDDILFACKDSLTISEVIKKLKKHPSGALYMRVEKVIAEYDIPIAKYSYGKRSYNTTANEKNAVHKICYCCSSNFTTYTKSQKYCSPKCKNESNKKYKVDVPLAIESIKQVGWTQTAKLLNLGDSFSDVNLRWYVKRYIKDNNLNIDFYKLSKYSKHSRFK